MMGYVDASMWFFLEQKSSAGGKAVGEGVEEVSFWRVISADITVFILGGL